MTHVILVGPMGSGKTTISNVLERDYGFRHWPAMTTRPIRDGEVDGRDYLFVDDKEFDIHQSSGRLKAVREYPTISGTWRYGFDTDSMPEDTDTVSILDPSGLIEVLDYIPDAFPVYLDINPEIRRYRVLTRGDDPDEIDRRFRQDEEDFAIFSEDFMKYCKLRIGKNRSPEANTERIIQGIAAYRSALIKYLNDYPN